MNIIELVKNILLEFPQIAEICNDIHIDFTENEDTDYGLSSINDIGIEEDILGNQIRQHQFVLHAVYQSLNDYDRMNNSGTLLKLQMYLEKIKNKEVSVVIDDTEYIGTLQKITCSNGMLYEIPLDNLSCAWKYQIQISAEYTIESEEF